MAPSGLKLSPAIVSIRAKYRYFDLKIISSLPLTEPHPNCRRNCSFNFAPCVRPSPQFTRQSSCHRHLRFDTSHLEALLLV